VGDIIFAKRNNLKLSQRELAQRCGVTQQFIQRIEKGRAMPSLRVAKKLAAALGCTVEELTGDNDQKEGA
jgi:transcriptional regulator with XRE-family HTH domain